MEISKLLDASNKITKLVSSPLNVIHIPEKSMKKSIKRTKKIIAADLQHYYCSVELGGP